MSTLPLTQRKGWTYRDYAALNDEQAFEIIDGEAMMAPAPEVNHQKILRNLFLALNRSVEGSGLGELLIAPTDVILSDTNVVQPDIVFVCKEREAIVQRRGIFGAPDLVVEILSPASQYHDLFRKRKLYERSAIAEYWVVDPRARSIGVMSLKEGIYDVHQEASLEVHERARVGSAQFPEIEVELSEVFRNLL